MGGNDNMEQALEDRVNNRSRRVENPNFAQYIGSNWLPRQNDDVVRGPAADYLPERYRKLGEQFLGERLVIPAGPLKVRSNDTDYRFRAHSAFAHLTGLGGEDEPDAVLVCEPLTDRQGTPLPEVNKHETEDATHRGVLYFKPRAPRGSDEFYADSRYGEFWVGPRPSLEEMETLTGLHCADIDTLGDALAKNLGQGHVQLRIVRNVDVTVEKMAQQARKDAGLPYGDDAKTADEKLEEALSTLRLCKDAYEISELQHSVDVTKIGFEEMLQVLPEAAGHHRGERVLEGAFAARARIDGNGLGYDTIVGAGNHACTLHWITNDGPVNEGDMVLIDAGVEADSLYTADITRTFPVNGRFNPVQRKVYQAVLDACEAALAQANTQGCKFRDLHDAAVKVLVDYLDEWGILPVSKEESLSPNGQHHRRWMPHGVSHHLGIDVHDCAQASKEMYLDATLEPGMCFTIEPGLYFHKDDAMIPKEFRGMGVRIEDDVIITESGAAVRLSEDIPRTIDDVEAWMAEVQRRKG
ncbi:MAG: aminopeptidase P family protein [Actinomycetaceae bacterium]|nr:aminopeptidase P family protein [Actinomycetaceae bacterium]